MPNSISSRDRGAPGLGNRPSIRFRVVRWPECWPEILELRRLAYGRSSRTGPDTAESVEPDPRDREAALVIGEEDGRVVASARVTPPSGGSLFHQDCQIEGPEDELPPHSELIECSFGCVHPDCRSNGLFWSLSAHMLFTAYRYGRPYSVGATDADIWPFWQRCGYRRTNLGYRGVFSGTHHRIMLADLKKVMAGDGIDPSLARELLPLVASGAADRSLP